jgi:16S rRNA (uracil1498-N3)-methyltransferase
MQAFHPFLAQLQGTGHLAHCYPQPKTPLKALSLQEEHTTLFIGPEGDFSPEEVAAAEARQVTMISLGPQRFRTETAGLLGCHSLLLNSRL